MGRIGSAPRRVRRHIAVAAAWLVLAALNPALAQGVVSDIPLADGRSERVLFAAPAGGPRATVVMLPGGSGIIDFDAAGNTRNNNFLIRTRPLWLAQGLAVAIIGSPNGASLMGQRHSPAYADAIGRAVDFARSRANAPVWLVGTSQGSTAAANGASRLGGKIAGVVLSSSETRANVSGEILFDSDPGAIAVPALTVANQGDSCPSTPPADAARIAASLARSPRKEIITVQSDQIQSHPCEALSPHGYLGIEASVIQRIAGWIVAAPGR